MLNWEGQMFVNGVEQASNFNFNSVEGAVHIKLFPKGNSAKMVANSQPQTVLSSSDWVVGGKYKITVKSYMTKKSTPTFDFMEKWNNNVPMPFRTMAGELLQETNGMVKMCLRGDIFATVTDTCICCGKPITNAVSKYFGLGPVCGGHNYVNPFDSDAELKQAVADYKKKLRGIVWEGWMPKSAITDREVYEVAE